MGREKTTVIFVNSSDKGSKILQVHTMLLKHWKYWLVAAVMFVMLLMALLIGYVHNRNGRYYRSYYHQKLEYGSKVSKAVDIERAKNTFMAIDDNILKINRFMEARGLEKLKIQGARQEFNDMLALNTVSDQYLCSVLKMRDLLEMIPLGQPSDAVFTSGFGTRGNPFGKAGSEFHKGLDFAGKWGSPVKATAAGKVIFAGIRGGYGKCVIVRHDNGFETLYGHLSKIGVGVGQDVKIGSVIGALGSTGRSTGPHLHYEVIFKGQRIDPKDYLNL
ncbi:M23 family metallopeptidase [Epilithonimonas sp.]|uniref:M23 family metallopeptidase n=1 Tax=Epilithonimonas sp. TaxID=2894511 RepID=UPI00289FDBDA|nr:M23 family metallopeptidase [Epilithonimonas sp.]